MIRIFNSNQLKQIDAYTINKQHISSFDLMERAAKAFYEEFIKKINISQPIYIFCGKGNNGGDALVVARTLLINKFPVNVFIIDSESDYSEDCANSLNKLQSLTNIKIIKSSLDIPFLSTDCVIIDGIFGSGLNRPIREGIYADVIKVLNRSECKIYSIDIPSGWFLENNSNNCFDNIIKADEVFTFQYPKLSLLLPESSLFCKKSYILNIGLADDCIAEEDICYFYLEKHDISSLIKKRDLFSHKGSFGHVLLFVGSKGKMGAAVMSSKACLRSGVGLLTIHTASCGVDILQTLAPEAMVSIDNSDHLISQIPNGIDLASYTIGIGPGIDTQKETKLLLENILKKSIKPLVIDADALNIISENPSLKEIIPPKSILTPHPLEFERLVDHKFENGYERLQSARKFAQRYDVYIVLKGAYSAIITPEKLVYFNSTGNPGMATGGSGDVLTGIITSLLAQKYTSFEAAIIGVYIHGLAGDIAAKRISEQSMLATDIIENLGNAFFKLKNDSHITTDY